MEPEYPKEQRKLVELLHKLGQKDAAYPPELLENRRALVLKLIAGSVAGVVISKGIFSTLKAYLAGLGKETLIQIILVTTLAAELGTGAYVFRDKWLDLFSKDNPTPAVISPALNNPSSPAPTVTLIPTDTPVPTPTFVLPTETESSPDNPSPAVNPTEPPVPATPEPTKPGKRLGQTPTPPGQQ